MIENKNNSQVKIGSERSFGFVFSFVFLIVACFPLLVDGGELKTWSLLAAVVFLFLAISIPQILKPLNILWFKFGFLLGKFVTPIIMAAMFFIVITPTGIILRLFNKDVLSLKINKLSDSYWVKRDIPVGDMKNQF